MPFDSTKLAYVSNHDGNGDLHALAHFMVEQIKADEEYSEPSVEQLYVNYELMEGDEALSKKQFIEKIKSLKPLEVEKFITPILEHVFNMMKRTNRLKKLVDLANYFGVKVHISAPAQPGVPPAEQAKRYAGFKPAKDVSYKPRVPGAALPDQVDITPVGVQVVSDYYEEEYEDGPPVMKLFLELSPSNLTHYNCYFESSNEDAELAAHNRDIEGNRQKLKQKADSKANPSFMSSLGAFVTMLGALAAKIIEVFSGIVQKFSAVSGGPSASPRAAGVSPVGGSGSSAASAGLSARLGTLHEEPAAAAFASFSSSASSSSSSTPSSSSFASASSSSSAPSSSSASEPVRRAKFRR